MSLGLARLPVALSLIFFSEYHLGWLDHLDTHLFSRPFEGSLLDTRLAFLFKTFRGVDFRHPIGTSFQDLSGIAFRYPFGISFGFSGGPISPDSPLTFFLCY